jgi:hypothetical protein
MKNQITLVLAAAIAALFAMSATSVMPFGVASASMEEEDPKDDPREDKEEKEREFAKKFIDKQDNDQYCILSDCAQVNQQNDKGDNDAETTFNDEIVEEEEEDESRCDNKCDHEHEYEEEYEDQSYM